MSEPQGPDFYSNDVFGIDEVFGFDVEMIPCQENIDAVIAWGAAKSKADEAKSAGDAAEANKSNDPDRPAA